MKYGFGYSMKCQEVDGGWQWLVKFFKQELGRGNSKSRKDAEAAMAKVIGEHQVKKLTVSNDKMKWRMKLRYWLTRRPYLIAAVVEDIIGGSSRKSSILQAKDAEEHWAKKDKHRIPIPTHYLTKDAADLAKELWEIFGQLGYITKDKDEVETRNAKKLLKWAEDTFGDGWFNPLIEDEQGGEDWNDVEAD